MERIKSEGLAVVLLAALSLAFFWKIALTNLILVGLDVFTYFYPYRAYAAEALREGRIPLWNPYLFLGAPFLANIQAAVLYPLNWMLCLLPAPRLVACSIILHIFLAGLFTYLFARLLAGLGRFGAFLSGVIFAFGGFLGAQVEHINQLNVFTWLPLSLLLYDRALHSGRWRAGYILLGGGVVALELLAGHIQAAYICLFALGIYMLGRWAAEGLDARSLLFRLAIYFSMVAVGMLLSAAQLLPTYELSRLSIRAGGLSYREAVSFSLRPHLLPYTFLPTFLEDLSQVFGESFGEYVAYVGVAGLVLALAGIVSARREGLPFILMASCGLFLGFGLYNPFYFFFYKLVPGFSSFRAPVRWLFLWAFGMAMLAGLGGDRWARGALLPAVVSLKERCLALWKTRRVALAVSGLALLAMLALTCVFMDFPGLGTLLIWLALAVVAAGNIAQKRRFLMLALVIAELLAAGQSLAYNNPTAPEAFSFQRPALTYLLTDRGTHRFISMSDITYDPGDLKDIQALFSGQLPPKAIYDYIVAEKRKEVLSFNLPLLYRLFSVDGYDGGVLPLKRYVEIQRLFLNEDEISPDGRLREQLKEVPDGRLLSLLNVKYVITDKVYDVWIDDVFYDLEHKAWLEAGEKAEFAIADLPRFEATAFGFISFLSGGAGLADGAEVAEITVSDGRGWEDSFTLRAGKDTAEGEYDPGKARHAQARVGHRWRGRPEGADYIATFNWGEPHRLERISIRYLAGEGKLCLRGLSLIDRRTGAHLPLTFSSSGRFRLVHSGDVKIYENLDVIPRAFIVHRARVVGDDRAAIALMKGPSFRPEEEAILASGSALEGERARGDDRAEIVSYEPEHVAVEVELGSEGYLILTDAFYPGWKALVDGKEAPLMRADVLFRAVYLMPGIHKVEFIYSPASFKIGVAVSLISLLGWGGGLGLLALTGAKGTPLRYKQKKTFASYASRR